MITSIALTPVPYRSSLCTLQVYSSSSTNPLLFSLSWRLSINQNSFHRTNATESHSLNTTANRPSPKPENPSSSSSDIWQNTIQQHAASHCFNCKALQCSAASVQHNTLGCLAEAVLLGRGKVHTYSTDHYSPSLQQHSSALHCFKLVLQVTVHCKMRPTASTLSCIKQICEVLSC